MLNRLNSLTIHSSRTVCACCALAGALLTGATANASAQTPTLPPVVFGQPVATPTTIRVPGVTGLLRDAVTDFRQLPSRDTLTWLTIGALAASLDHRADADVSRALSGSNGLDRVLDSGARIGSARVQLGGALATYAFGRIAGKPVIADVGADLVRANIVAQTLTSSTKLAVRRTRPDGMRYSFPSGHTSVSFATATVLQRRFGWKVGVPAYAVGTYVAASRIQDKRHFLSDVTFGAALGIVAGRTVTIGRGSHRLAIAPVPVPGGAAVGLTLVSRN